MINIGFHRTLGRALAAFAATFSALALSPLAGAAQAATVVITDINYADPGLVYGHFTVGGSPTTPPMVDLTTAPAGRFQVKADSGLGEFYAYCMDLTRPAEPGIFNLVPAASILTPGRSNALTALFGNAAPPIDNDHAAAIQLAAWELLYDDGTDVTSGTFRSANGLNGSNLAPAQAIANAYLGNIRNGTWTAPAAGVLTALTSDQHQSLITYAVPEPSTWAMMILGFGLVGGAVRKRRSPALA